MSCDSIDFASMVIRKIFQSYHEHESLRSVVSLSLNCVPKDGKQNLSSWSLVTIKSKKLESMFRSLLNLTIVKIETHVNLIRSYAQSLLIFKLTSALSKLELSFSISLLAEIKHLSRVWIIFLSKRNNSLKLGEEEEVSEFCTIYYIGWPNSSPFIIRVAEFFLC